MRGLAVLEASLALALGACTPAPPAVPAAGTPVAPSASASAAHLPLFDAHIHYNDDAWSAYPPETALRILREAGITRALVSSTPDEGTMRLARADPELVVAILRPYRTTADSGTWARDGTVLPYLESRFVRGTHRGIGEVHLRRGEAQLPAVRAVVAMAVREGILLEIHADAVAVEEVFAVDPRARILWAHAGFDEPATVRAMLDRHAALWAELAGRSDVAPDGHVDAAWRELFLAHPDRFLYGTDTYVNDQWAALGELASRARVWLRELPADVAARIAHGNGERLFAAR